MIIYLDFRSLYPVMMIGGNVFSPAKQGEPYWQGSGIYASVYQNNYDGVKGKYSRIRGSIENALYELLKKRLLVKDDPKASLAIKILINTMYGISGSPKFKSVFNITTASDITSLARRSILHARTVLEEYGYEVLYTDTDSAFIKDPYNDLDKLKQVTDYIVDQQRRSMNIPNELHDFKIECVIKRMYFFRNDSNNYVKKQYIYVTDDNKVKAKGIRIVRGDCSPIAKTVYEKYIKPLALEGKSLKLSIEQITNWLKDEIKANPEQLKKRYRLKPLDQYKIAEGKDESSALHAQLSKRYGAGEHYFVVNKRIGPGKGNHYCTLEELKEKYGDQWVDQIKLDMYLNDLKCFVCDEERKKIK